MLSYLLRGKIDVGETSQSQTAHGVVESTADAPCTQRQGGFDSGLVNPGGNFSVLVNSSSREYLLIKRNGVEA